MTTIFASGPTGPWPVRVQRYLQDQLKVSRSLLGRGVSVQSYETALEQLSAHLQSLYFGGGQGTRNADALGTLGREVFAAAGYTGPDYKPSPGAYKLLARVGKQGAIDPKEVLIELLALEARDAGRRWSESVNEHNNAKQQAEQATARANHVQASARITERTLSETSEALAATQVELARVQAQAEHLSGQLEALDVAEPVEASAEAAAEIPQDDRPAAELLEQIVAREKRRVLVAPNVYLELREGAPWYRFRKGAGKNEQQLWLAPEANVSLPDAIAACERWANAHDSGTPSAPVAAGVSTTTSNSSIDVLLAEAVSANEGAS